jgi:hypothetical protein
MKVIAKLTKKPLPAEYDMSGIDPESAINYEKLGIDMEDKNSAKMTFLKQQASLWESMELELGKASAVSLGKAQLVFLNEIEKNTTKSADAVSFLKAMPEILVKAIDRQTLELSPRPLPDTKPLDFSPIIESSLNVSNTILKYGDKIESKISGQTKIFSDSLNTVVVELNKISKPKKWKFTIDRNFTTGKIQEVIAEQIKD